MGRTPPMYRTLPMYAKAKRVTSSVLKGAAPDTCIYMAFRAKPQTTVVWNRYLEDGVSTLRKESTAAAAD